MRRKATIRLLLGATAVVLLTLLLTFAFKHQMTKTISQAPPAPEENAADLSINNFQHTATREGKIQWRLEAESASFFSDNKRVRLKNIRVIFFPKSAESETRLDADSGILDIQTHDMDIMGNIIIKNQQYRLRTETLHYSHELHIISTKKPVNIVGPSIQLRANTMKVDLKKGEMKCKGNVEGMINADGTL